MTYIYNNWLKTKNYYTNWLNKSELKKIFAVNLKFEKLSLWWLTNLMTKDTIVDNFWYKNLHLKLNKKKIKNYNNYYNFSFFKYLLRFFFTIFFNLIIKFIFLKPNNKNFFTNTFFCYDNNFIKYKKKMIDRQYGLLQLKNKSENCNLIFIIPSFKKIFKVNEIKKNLSNSHLISFTLNSYISIFDIIKIYYFCAISYFKLKIILNKKNYFMINNLSCKIPLENYLKKSFYGEIQDQIIYGLAIRKFLSKNNIKNFYTYFEFLHYSRSFYYFIKNSKSCPKIISINHYLYDKNTLFFNLYKKDFSNYDNFLFHSPKPDVFLNINEEYSKYLKKIFPKNKNIYSIGFLKNQLIKKDKLRKNIFNFYKKKLLKEKKKTLSIFLNLKDYSKTLNYLKNMDLTKFYLIVRPHPAFKELKDKILNDFKKKMNTSIDNLSILNNLEVIKISDYIFFDEGQIILDILNLKRKNTKVAKLIDEDIPLDFDKNKNYSILSSKIDIKKFLNIKY